MTANTSLTPVWKVVLLRSSQRWCSGFPKHTLDDAARAREYSPTQPTVPAQGCGSLTAFRTLRAALDFVEKYGGIDHEVWAAVAVRAPHSAVSIWDGSAETALDRLPEGTVLCSQIGLLKNVDDFAPEMFDALLGDSERLQDSDQHR